MTAEVHAGWQLARPRRLETRYGTFSLQVAREIASDAQAWLLTRGDVGGPEPLLARVHSACITSETFGACDCDCAEQLDAALARIAATGRGALFYLFQEGRGAGFLAKARDRMLVQASGERLTTFDAYAQMGLRADERDYGCVASIAAWAGVAAPLILLTNNPHKRDALEAAGLAIEELAPLARGASPYNAHYLGAKERSGHRLGASPARAALPERVLEFAPRAVAGAPALVEMARYLLPVRPGDEEAGAPLWIWLHAFHDRESDAERVAFHVGDPRRADAVVRVHEQVLLERLSLPRAPARDAWMETLEAFAAVGHGAAVFLAPGSDRDAPDAATAALLSYLTGARASR